MENKNTTTNEIKRVKPTENKITPIGWIGLLALVILMSALVFWNMGYQYPHDLSVTVKSESENSEEWNSFEFTAKDIEYNKELSVASEDLHNEIVVKITIK